MNRFFPRWLALLVAAHVTAFAGCHCRQTASTAPTVPAAATGAVRGTVSVAGAVARPGELPLPTDPPTLKRVVAAAGGVIPSKDVNGRAVEMLVRFQRGERMYLVSAAVIDETECGSILAKAGDRFEAVPWTKTDLFRGLKEGEAVRLPVPPTETGDLEKVFAWFRELTGYKNAAKEEEFKQLDNVKRAQFLRDRLPRIFDQPVPTDRPDALAAWGRGFIAAHQARAAALHVKDKTFVQDVAELKRQYAIDTASRVLRVEVINEMGRKATTAFERTVTPTATTIQAPNLLGFTDDTGLGEMAVLSLERTVDGIPSVFLLSRTALDAAKDDTRSPAGNLLKNALVFDGDTITLALPQDVPIVRASLVMSQLRSQSPPKK